MNSRTTAAIQLFIKKFLLNLNQNRKRVSLKLKFPADMGKQKYYVYFVPRINKKGVTDNWKECEKIIHGEINSRFRGFKNLKEAEEWLKAGAVYGFKKKLESGIYFDSGTGRGLGVEISVTDENGNNLLIQKKFKKH